MYFCILIQWTHQYEHIYSVGDASTHPSTQKLCPLDRHILITASTARGVVKLSLQASFFVTTSPVGANILGCWQISIRSMPRTTQH